MKDLECQELIIHSEKRNEGISSSFSENLLTAVINNNEEQLNNALPETTETDFTNEHSYNGTKKILTLACVESRVSENIFQILLDYAMDHFSDLDFTEKKWYYWEPIHFAACHTNVDKLGTIAKRLKEKNKLNVLTIFSENALHVLLEYGRRIDSFNVQLSNGWESRICHVIAKEKPEVVQCAKLLIDAGIDVNHSNIWNETPIIIAIRYRLMEVIELLLRRSDIDLDTCKDSVTGKSARDILRQNEISLHLLTPSTVTVSPVKTLFTFLKNGDEEMFLRYNNENIRQYANEIDGDQQNRICRTMLQLCLIKGYTDYEKEVAIIHPPQETDILKTPMLKFFCQGGFGRSIEHLLNNGAEITKKTMGDLDVFQVAVKLSYYPFLAILLEHRTRQITQYHILEVLRNTKEASFKSQNYNVRHVLFLLISKLEMYYAATKQDVIDVDSRSVLNNILDLYLLSNGTSDEYRDNICQVLRLGASLTGSIDATPEKRLSKMSFECLRSHLDECISPSNDVCYNSLVRDDHYCYSETEALHFLIHDSKKSDLLNHPALVYLIHRKWVKSSKFFYLNLGLYTIFLFSLYWYTVLLQINRVNTSSFVFFVVFLSFVTGKELMQLLLYFPRYFFDISNYLEISIIVCCFINIFSKNEITMIIAILLSTLIFLLMLGQLPKFTKYMIIFSSTKYFLEYASFYFIQFVSFALCFFILLPPQENGQSSQFGEILIKLFDTLIFFIGQYDGDITSPPNFPVFGRIVVATFIFCMTIILNNLLVGLIVTDMDVIQKTGKQLRQVKMIRYITRIENFLKGADRLCCRKVFRSCFGDTNVFRKGDYKVITNITDRPGVFDDDDKAYLKEIHANRLQQKNVLSNLYEYIVNEIYSSHRGASDNKDILFKLSRLEEQLMQGRPSSLF